MSTRSLPLLHRLSCLWSPRTLPIRFITITNYVTTSFYVISSVVDWIKSIWKLKVSASSSWPITPNSNWNIMEVFDCIFSVEIWRNFNYKIIWYFRCPFDQWWRRNGVGSEWRGIHLRRSWRFRIEFWNWRGHFSRSQSSS